MDFDELGAATGGNTTSNLARGDKKKVALVSTGGWRGASSSMCVSPCMTKSLNELLLSRVPRSRTVETLSRKQHA